MSPRSEEFLDGARRKLTLARVALAAGLPQDAAGAAYYAMLNAARAALSEENLYAKTHRGVWTQFSATFVKTGRLDAQLATRAEKAREAREEADYGVGGANAAEAETMIAHAEAFITAVEGLYG